MPTIELEEEDIERVEALTNQTLIIDVSFGKWGNSKKVDAAKYFPSNDEEADGDDEDGNDNPDAEMLRMSKRLIKSEEYEAIVNFDSVTRKEIKKFCMPSQFSDGEYIVHINRFSVLKEYIEERKRQRSDLVMAFMAVYADIANAQRDRLRREWNSEDYDDPEKVASKFIMTYRVRSFDVPGTLAIVSKDEFENQKWRTQQLMADMVEENRVLVRAGVQSVLDKIIETLTPSADGQKKVFRDSAYANLLGAINDFSVLNIANDKEMETLITRLKEMTSIVPNAEMLRKSDGLKSSVNAQFMAIRDEIKNLVRDKPKRTIIVED